MRLYVLLLMASNFASAVVYVRLDATNQSLASLPPNLINHCAKGCEKTVGCSGFSITSGLCTYLSAPLPSSPSDISFVRTMPASATCPAGSKHFATFGPNHPATGPQSTSVSSLATSSSSSVSAQTSASTPVSQASVSSTLAGTITTTNANEASTLPLFSQTGVTGTSPGSDGSGVSSTLAGVKTTLHSYEGERTEASGSSIGSIELSTSTTTTSIPQTSVSTSTASASTPSSSSMTHPSSSTTTVSLTTSTMIVPVDSTKSSKSVETVPTSVPSSMSSSSTTSLPQAVSSGTVTSSSTITSTTTGGGSSTASAPSSTSSTMTTSSTSTTTASIPNSTSVSTSTSEPETTSTSTTTSSMTSSTTTTEPSTASTSTTSTMSTTSPSTITSTSTFTTPTPPSSTSSTTSTEPTSTSTTTALSSTTTTTEPTTTSTSTSAITSTTTTTSTSSTTTELPTSTSTAPTSTTVPTTSTSTASSTMSTPSTTSTSTTTTTSPTTTEYNVLSQFKFVDVPGSNVSCFYETRSKGRFSTNGLCALEGSDPCKAQGLVSVFGSCAGKSALKVVPDWQCASTLSYTNTLCVPWEAMFADKANPTANGIFSNKLSCPSGTGLADGGGNCAPNLYGAKMLTGRYTDNLLTFSTADDAGLIISSCYAYNNNLQYSFCPVRPNYPPASCIQTNSTHGNTGWTQTANSTCAGQGYFKDMNAGGCPYHSIRVYGSGGERCVGWDVGSTTTPFKTTQSTVSNWFVWDGTKSTNYDTVLGTPLTYKDCMVLPRVLVTPV